MKNILFYLLGAMLLASAVAHIIKPDFYATMIPQFIPLGLANITAAIVEAIIGVLLFIPKGFIKKLNLQTRNYEPYYSY